MMNANFDTHSLLRRIKNSLNLTARLPRFPKQKLSESRPILDSVGELSETMLATGTAAQFENLFEPKQRHADYSQFLPKASFAPQMEASLSRTMRTFVGAFSKNQCVVLRRFNCPYNVLSCADWGGLSGQFRMHNMELLESPELIRLPRAAGSKEVRLKIPADLFAGPGRSQRVNCMYCHYRLGNAPLMTFYNYNRVDGRYDPRVFERGMMPYQLPLLGHVEVGGRRLSYYKTISFEMWAIDSFPVNDPMITGIAINVSHFDQRFAIVNIELPFSAAMKTSVGFPEILNQYCDDWQAHSFG